MNKFGQFEVNDHVIDRESGEHGIVREVGVKLANDTSGLLNYAVEITDPLEPLDTPDIRVYVTDELRLEPQEAAKQIAESFAPPAPDAAAELAATKAALAAAERERDAVQAKLDTARIGLKQAQKVAAYLIEARFSDKSVYQPSLIKYQEIAAIVKEALEQSS